MQVEAEVEPQTEEPQQVLSRTSVVSAALEAGPKTDVVVETKEHVTVFLKFAFSMEEFIINLYSGGFKSVSLSRIGGIICLNVCLNRM